MSLLHTLTARLKGKFSQPFPKTKHVIKPAFESGGIQYFEFDTTANLPWKRGLKFISIYQELEMKCDKFYLEKHCEAMDALFSKKQIGLDEIIQMRNYNAVLKERLKWVYNEDLIYKVCSVVFFDANENPDDWEWKYAAEKIERWKKEGVNSFFLHEPIQRLIPFLSSSNFNFESYSEAQHSLDKAQLENIYMNLSESLKESSYNYTSRYFSQEMKADLKQ